MRDHKIKTIVALAHPADHYSAVQERKLAAELGVTWVHIPIVDNRGTNDRAAEDAISDLLDQAAGDPGRSRRTSRFSSIATTV